MPEQLARNRSQWVNFCSLAKTYNLFYCPLSKVQIIFSCDTVEKSKAGQIFSLLIYFITDYLMASFTKHGAMHIVNCTIPKKILLN